MHARAIVTSRIGVAMENDVADILEVIGEACAGKRWHALAVAIVVVVVRLYRRPDVQALVPASLRWNRIAFPWRLLLVFGAAAGSSLVTGILGGQTIGAVVLTAVSVGIAAVGAHKVSKAAGHAQTSVALRKSGPLYKPGSIRTALEPVFPIDRRAIELERGLAATRARAKRNA